MSRFYLRSLILAAFASVLAGCPEGGLRKAAPAGAKALTSVGCVLTKARTVRELAARVQLPAEARRPELCANPAHYVCHERVFAPDAAEGRSSRSECVDVAGLGGPGAKACLTVTSLGFNTREAASRPDADPRAVEPGGDYNRNEYLCHHAQIKAGEEALVLGEGDSLAEALKKSHEKCAELLPLLTEQGS